MFGVVVPKPDDPDSPEPRDIIIALEGDLRICRALAAAPKVDFYHYDVIFNLHKEF